MKLEETADVNVSLVSMSLYVECEEEELPTGCSFNEDKVCLWYHKPFLRIEFHCQL